VGKAWYDTIPQIFDEIQALERATRTLRELPHDVIDIVARARYLAEERPTKRARLDEEADNSSSLSSATPKSPAPLSTTIELLPPVVVVLSPESSPPAPAQKLPAGSNIYWDSADAKNLFNASDNETSLHRLDDLVEVLEHVNQLQSVGYKSIVAGHDADDSLSEHKKTEIRNKALYLAYAYREARNEMPFKTWGDCCQDTIISLANVGITYIKTSKVLERWNIEFRDNKMFYPKSRSKHDLPPLLDAFPIIVTIMKEYGRANLADLTIEMMHSYLHDTVIKSLVLEEHEDKKAKQSGKEYEVEAKRFMANYGLTCICNETVYRWMLRIGFKHETRRKGYFGERMD
jgi:hypothetical protein